ncbi:hypothetical protein BV22DRAFT_1025201, partial [Leucogyrophana mollusca]
RRGMYHAAAVGVSYGSGQERPRNLSVPHIYRPAVDALLDDEGVQRAAGFQSSCLKLYSPSIYKFYKTNIDAIFDADPTLLRNFKSSIFPAVTFNLGPDTVTYPHKDPANLAWGWCAITPFGSYDPALGGHIVLWDVGVVIEFPPGATILIPSAIVQHSNTLIQDGETRFSLTQYAAGPLFAWVYNGFRSDVAVNKDRSMTAEDRERRTYDRAHRWENAMKMFTHISQLW